MSPATWIKRVAAADVPLVAAVLGGAAAVLRVFPPGPGSIYPPCPFWWATGWLCPGCGALRSLRALTDGDLARAWAMNPLLVIFIGGLVGALLMRALRLDVRVPAWVYPAIPVVIAGFWIARNF